MRKVIAVIAVAIVGLLIFAATRPNDFRVQRSTRIKAAPDEILAFINDFHRWKAWSPYEKYDPALKRAYDGAPSGKGAVYAWDGNSQAGRGRMEILETTPTKTVIKLDFFAPFEGHNSAEFSAVPAGDATEVTWAMNGPSQFITKLMGVFMNMDKMIGKDFEEGLATLKTQAEK